VVSAANGGERYSRLPDRVRGHMFGAAVSRDPTCPPLCRSRWPHAPPPRWFIGPYTVGLLWGATGNFHSGLLLLGLVPLAGAVLALHLRRATILSLLEGPPAIGGIVGSTSPVGRRLTGPSG
jgi:hypothetical protein